MAFSEKIKIEVKQKAAFQCCRCREIGVDVHHIIPQADGGPDDIDNAAPLCQNCHDRFGANPEKRKEIRQMRDWWYDVVKEKYSGSDDLRKDINELILEIQKHQDEQFDGLRKHLELKLNELQKQTRLTKNDSSDEIQHKASAFVSATRLGHNVHANFHCRKCNTMIGLLIGSNKCPNCGEAIT